MIKNNTPKYGLPKDVVFCKRCVISNQRPSSAVEFKAKAGDRKETIAFGADGVCDACRYAEHKETINWKVREKELIKLCDKHRSKDGRYDCIVPGSGGKDSAFASHILKYKYGMNPLTVTWSPHMYTDIGWKNFERWIHVGGLDNVLFTPNGKVHRMLTKLAFENLLHPFQPFIIGQKYIGPKFAVQYQIPLIFYGENQAEYGNKIADNDVPTMKKEFFTQDISLNQLFLGGVSASELIKNEKLSLNDLNPYLPVSKKEIEKLKAEVHFLGYYLKWDSQECYYYAAKNTGFQANSERTEGSYSKYSSIDDKTDPFHYYTTLAKFGLGRASYDAAQEIRNGKITREEGVALVKRFDQEFPKKYFKEFLAYVDMSEEKFHKFIDAGRSPHIWDKKNGEWSLKHQVS
ncbi:MAG: N-acetyl sugar amidotransferase [Candidatus Pacebacteria bacterium]|jgi:N-acetyl sugar amidotransferase|nr:N-acetyl sugar amidotransferase [Candidatus Paceibacterota bacterium]